MARVLSILTLLCCLFALGDYREPAVITGTQVIQRLIVLPMSLLAFGLVCYGLVRLPDPKFRSYYSAVAGLAMPLLILDGFHLIASAHEQKRERDVTDWYTKANSVAAILLEYYHQHPERFHFIADSEEVTVDGFLAFCQTRPEFQYFRLQHDSTQLLDYSNHHFRYYVDANHDGFTGPFPSREISASIVPVSRGGVCIVDSQGAYPGTAPRTNE